MSYSSWISWCLVHWHACRSLWLFVKWILLNFQHPWGAEKRDEPGTNIWEAIRAPCQGGEFSVVGILRIVSSTRPFRYDLNQIPYDYTVEVRNRFKGLDLIDRVPDELWNEVCDIVQETGIKTISMERNAKKQNGCLGRPYKQLWKEEKWKAKEKRKDINIWMQSSKE